MKIDPSNLNKLPSDVGLVIESLLEKLDRTIPDQIKGLYLVGSLALGDYRSGQSDIDFIAVVDPSADMSSLAGVHRTLADTYPAVNCDGIYLRQGELALPPTGVGPAAREGVVTLSSADERHPITWLTLHRHGLAARGDIPSSTWINTDVRAASEYSRNNLLTYWAPWLNQRRSDLSSDWAVVWGCLGVARLHAAIVNGDIVSKSGGGYHALAHFPQHRAIIDEALLLRQGGFSGYSSTNLRAEAVMAFMDDLIDSIR